jgi:hypothetical protein
MIMSQPAEVFDDQEALEPPIPMFEGQNVSRTIVKISGLSSVDGEMSAFGIEDRVRLVGEFKCVKVLHEVDPKTGDLVRVQVLTPSEVSPCPWDPNNPHDDGVLRRR